MDRAELESFKVSMALDAAEVEWGERISGHLLFRAGRRERVIQSAQVWVAPASDASATCGTLPPEIVRVARMTLPPGTTREYRFHLLARWQLALVPLQVHARLLVAGDPEVCLRGDVRITPPGRYHRAVDQFAAVMGVEKWEWAPSGGEGLVAVLQPEGPLGRELDLLRLRWPRPHLFNDAVVEVNLSERTPADLLRALRNEDRLAFPVRLVSRDPADKRELFRAIRNEIACRTETLPNLPLPGSAPDSLPRAARTSPRRKR